MGLIYLPFAILSFLSIISALYVITSKNPVHSVLWLIICMITICGHYVLINAQFLAIVNLIVYAGAIMVLFLFVLMLLNLNKDSEPAKPNYLLFAGGISGTLLVVVVVLALHNAMHITPNDMHYQTETGLVKNLGKLLFTKYVLPFELSGILFISAMVGAVLIGKRESLEVKQESI